MAKGKRTDTENIAKVIEAKINNPDLSSRDLMEETGVNYRTTARIIENDLSQVVSQSSRIASLIDRNNDLQSLADDRIQSMLKSGVEVIRLSELTSFRDSAFKQNQLLTGKNTENTEIKIKWEV